MRRWMPIGTSRRLAGRWGPDGADGQGQEHIYAVNDSASIPQGQRPSNNWPYDVPGTIGGLTWHDDPPDLTDILPILWRVSRMVVGNPATGDVVPALWLDPRIFGRFGADGAQGISGLDGIAGSRGDDGVGTEFVFAVTNSATLPNSQRPLNTWGYDQPGTVNGLTWSDGAPDVTANFPYLWRAQRRVVGQPPIGTVITDTWDEPSVEGRYGEDGDDGIAGARGDDGAGVEYVFAVTNSATLPSSQNPAEFVGVR